MPEWIKKYLKNVFAGYGLRLVQLGLNLLAIPVLLSALGEVSYGWLIFLSTAVGYFSLLNFGVADAMSKFVAEFHAAADWEKLRQLISTVFALFLLMAAIAAVGCWGVTRFSWGIENERTVMNMVLLTGGMCLGAWPLMAVQGIYQGLQQQPFMNSVMGSARVVCILGAIHGARTDWSLEWILLVFNADKFLLTPLLLFGLRRYLSEPFIAVGAFSMAMFRRVFSFSRWLMMARVATFLEYQMDSLLIMTFVGPAGVALYSVLCTPFNMIQQFSGIAAGAVVPVMSVQNVQNDTAARRSTVLNGSRLHNAFLACVCVVLLLSADGLLNLWLNGRYAEHYWLIKVLIGFQAVWQANAFLGSCVAGMGHAKRLGGLALATGVFNVLLSVALVQLYGTHGVIYGTLAAGVLASPIAACLFAPQAGVKVGEYVGGLIRSQLPVWVCGILILLGSELGGFSLAKHWMMTLAISGVAVASVVYLMSVRPLLSARRSGVAA